MALTDEQRMDRRRAKRRESRMAGDALKEAGESSDLASNEAGDADGLGGFRNNLERRIGTEEYERIGARGHDAATGKGKYSAQEVISEFRNRGKGVGVDKGEGSMVDYFQGLVNDGAKFNGKAQEYLKGHGVTFGGGGGGGDTDPTPSPEPSPEEPPAPPSPNPVPTPQPTPPITVNPGRGGGGNTQIVDNHAINSQVVTNYGDNSTINAGVDQSVTATQNAGGYAYKAKPLRDAYVLNLLRR